MTEKRMSGKGKGNPNPSPATRFKAGERANPAGKTSAQKKAEMKSGELAARIQAKMLEALSEQSGAEIIAALTGSDIVRMVKDAMDREFGTATQKVEASGANGGPLVIKWQNADD